MWPHVHEYVWMNTSCSIYESARVPGLRQVYTMVAYLFATIIIQTVFTCYAGERLVFVSDGSHCLDKVNLNLFMISESNASLNLNY
jgi:hypothetical protein